MFGLSVTRIRYLSYEFFKSLLQEPAPKANKYMLRMITNIGMIGRSGWSGKRAGSSTIKWTYVATVIKPIATSAARRVNTPTSRIDPMNISRQGTNHMLKTWNGMLADCNCPANAMPSEGTINFIMPVITNIPPRINRMTPAQVLSVVLKIVFKLIFICFHPLH